MVSVQNTILINYTVILFSAYINHRSVTMQSSCHMMLLLLTGIGGEVASVSLVLNKSQSDAVELKPDDDL